MTTNLRGLGASCCPLCAPLPGITRLQAVQRGVATAATPAASADTPWPHRAELRVSALEKFTSAPEPDFPGVVPLDFVRHSTGFEVRSVTAEAFPGFWRTQFREILEAKGAPDEHADFWASGASNGRPLQWRVLEIPPNSAYPLHIHPGVEVYLCVRGVLHESRMRGEPLLRGAQFDDAALVASTLDFSSPDFDRSFEHRRLEEGGFNVNEIGSVHQVYTEQEGAILMVLGAGANVTIEPEQWPSGEHPFRSTTVAGTGGWQGTKGGALAPKDDGQ